MPSENNETKEQIIKVLEQTGALKFGEFTLASGAKSKYYIDMRVIPNYPREFDLLIEQAVEYLQKNCSQIEGIVGIPLTGIPFGVLIAYKLGKPFYLLRKEPKEYGLKKMIEGEIEKGQRILIVDDLITSGGSKVYAIEALREIGAEVKDVFLFIDRTPDGLAAFEKEQGIKVHYLINAEDILKRVR
ncbi:MAG: orotate phosphoribosyltransferase [Candidatus Heimdallarchaeota archaeon]|nr:orotate phosphoribosyltransferase [Candidatus Heimdallarchaeota archaeon]